MGEPVDHRAFAKARYIDKGWSNDIKYRLETVAGETLLLRVTDIAWADRKRHEFEMMQRVAALGVPMSRPVAFGLCGGGGQCYSLLTWCPGQDAEELLPRVDPARQAQYGRKAGRLLRRMHTLPATGEIEPWGRWFGRKLQGRLDALAQEGLQSPELDILLDYFQHHRDDLNGRPQTFTHGDFHSSNLIITPQDEIGIIDFNYYNLDHGDPWWDFCSTGWGQEIVAPFETGKIQGYFDGEPPSDFFPVLMYYFAYDALAAVCATAQGEEGEPEDGRRHLRNVLRWFDGLKNPVPTWYRPEDVT